MKSVNIFELNKQLKAFAIFRDLLEDEVIKSLSEYIDRLEFVDSLEDSFMYDSQLASAYSEFVSKLYNEACGELGLHIKSICYNSENVYVKLIGQGKAVPDFMNACLEKELETLQCVAELKPEELTASLKGKCFMPGFAFGGVSIAEGFKNRAANIGKYGYGMYARNRMFFINADNSIVPVKNPDNISLSMLVDYEAERQPIIDNTKALLEGKPAANALITGDAGTGKSSSVKAIANEFYAEGLRIIEVRKDQLALIPAILDELATNPLKFILFIDDLSFRKDDDNFNALKAVLEGSVSSRSKNVVIYATSNRRHIIKETFSEREGDEIHRNDTMQEFVSLSERFGLHVRFFKPAKTTYLHIVKHLVEEQNIVISDEELELLAERFALERGGRSARLARQFVDSLALK